MSIEILQSEDKLDQFNIAAAFIAKMSHKIADVSLAHKEEKKLLYLIPMERMRIGYVILEVINDNMMAGYSFAYDETFICGINDDEFEIMQNIAKLHYHARTDRD